MIIHMGILFFALTLRAMLGLYAVQRFNIDAPGGVLANISGVQAIDPTVFNAVG